MIDRKLETFLGVSSSLSLSFGQSIRALRQAQGLTQVEFSERCGFYQTYLSRVENGQANPTLNAIEVMANALGLTVYEMFYLMETALEMPDRV